MNFLKRLLGFGRKPEPEPCEEPEPQLPRRLSQQEENKARDLLCPACHGEMEEGKVKVCRHCGKAYIIIDERNAAQAQSFIEALKKEGIII